MRTILESLWWLFFGDVWPDVCPPCPQPAAAQQQTTTTTTTVTTVTNVVR